MTEHNMFNSPKGSGLLLVKPGDEEDYYVVSEIDMKIPLSEFEKVDSFLVSLSTLIRHKVAHETLYHFILVWRDHGRRSIYTPPPRSDSEDIGRD